MAKYSQISFYALQKIKLIQTTIIKKTKVTMIMLGVCVYVRVCM